MGKSESGGLGFRAAMGEIAAAMGEARAAMGEPRAAMGEPRAGGVDHGAAMGTDRSDIGGTGIEPATSAV